MSLVQQSAVSKHRREHLSSKLLTYAHENRGQEIFDDVMLEVESECIPASRLVLSCYSTYFEKMFKCRMKERYENSVKLSGLDALSVKSLVNFIYTGELIIDGENVMGLLRASDYLQLHDAKNFCFEYLIDRITSENCFVILPAAKLYDHKVLTNKIYDFISNHFDKISAGIDFRNLAHDQLISCISHLDRDQAKESSLFSAIITWTKQEKESRIEILESLLRLLNPDKFPDRFLEEIVASEALLQDNIRLCNLVLEWLAGRMKRGGMTQIQGKILTLQEGITNSKLIELYSKKSAFDTDRTYPELPAVFNSFDLFRLQNYLFCLKKLKTVEEQNNIMFQLDLATSNGHWIDMEVDCLDLLRIGAGSAVFSDTIVVSGGFVTEENELKSCIGYVALLNDWKILPSMSEKRSNHILVSCNHCLYAMGGKATNRGTSYSIKSVEKLSAIGGDWDICGALLTSRCDFAAVSCDQMIYVIGGHTKEGKPKGWKSLKSVEKFDPVKNQWMFVSEMKAERHGHSACVIHGKIYVVGGCNDHGDINCDIACYDPLVDGWSVVGQTTFDLTDHSIAAI